MARGTRDTTIGRAQTTPARIALTAATSPSPGQPAGSASGPASPRPARRDLRSSCRSGATSALFWRSSRSIRVEGRALDLVTSIALAALPVHYLLPYRWKKPSSWRSRSLGLFGSSASAPAGYVLLLAGVLIGVCYLPIAWSVRAAIVALGRRRPGLARVSTGSSFAASPTIVWPVLASMFMFRMILYMYELKHAEKPEPLVDTLGYFFLLPNYCFLHFPVVDYRTLRRGYFSPDIHATQPPACG